MAFVADVFKHIISIGYEFETHDISKITLQNGKMIVSNISMQGLKNRIESKEAVKIDDHYYHIYNHDEYINDIDMDGDRLNKDIIMHTTVDFTDADFDSQLKPHCKNSTRKNTLYAFKLDNTIYPITFAGHLADVEQYPCSNFSGVEWIITYYKPPSSDKIITNTYIDACQRIIEQLNSLEKQSGSFIIRDTNKLVGYKYRHIWHKPNTNFYFLQRNDGIRTKTGMNKFSIQSIQIVPQMTFCAKSIHAMDIMDRMLKINPTTQTKITQSLDKLQKEFSNVYHCTKQLFKEPPILQLTDDEQKMSICMLGLILYKLVVYINRYSIMSKKKKKNWYFKDLLTFSVRHSNVVLYDRLKELVGEDVIIGLLAKTEIIQQLFTRKVVGLDKMVRKKHRRYGDPLFSFRSYFDCLNDGKDWLEENDIVNYTAMYDFKDDILMIEHREFGPTIATMMVDRKINVKGFAPTVSMISALNDTLLSEHNAIHTSNKIYNRKTQRYRKKCNRGEIRNAKFTCRKRGTRPRVAF